MTNKFEQISVKPGFMMHNGGLYFRKISDEKYEFKTVINKNHLNKAGITHGGFICSIIDAGSGSAAHQSAKNNPCVTISLDVKFISPTKEGDEILGTVNILKKTKSMIFLNCQLTCKAKIVANASGVWKMIRTNQFNFGPGG